MEPINDDWEASTVFKEGCANARAAMEELCIGLKIPKEEWDSLINSSIGFFVHAYQAQKEYTQMYNLAIKGTNEYEPLDVIQAVGRILAGALLYTQNLEKVVESVCKKAK